MSGHNRPAGANRTLLALLGVVLLAAGLFALLTGYHVLHLVPADHSVLPAGRRLLSWVPYVVVAAAIVVGLLCLWWLGSQGRRRPRSGVWQLADEPDAGTTVLPARLAVDPLVEEVGEYPGVVAATGWLTGQRGEPQLTLVVHTEHTADLTALRGEIAAEAVPRLRQALEVDAVAVTVQFEPTGTAGRLR